MRRSGARQLLAIDHPDHPVDAGETPPAKSPLLNFGVMSSSMMRLVVTSVSAPSRP